MPYRLSALAERDLEEIWSYVAEDASPQPPTDSLTPSSTDSICWWSSRGWVVLVRSSALAFDRFRSRVTLSTTAMRTSCWSLEYFMDDATKRRRGRSPAQSPSLGGDSEPRDLALGKAAAT